MQDLKELFNCLRGLRITKSIIALTFMLICCKLAPEFMWWVVGLPFAVLVLIIITLVIYGSSRRDKSASN